MDQQKLKQIVDDSVFSDEGKDLIYGLLPFADKTEVQDEILKIMDYEIKLSNMLAEEAQQLKVTFEMAAREIEDGEDRTSEKINEVMEDLNARLDELAMPLEEEKARLEEIAKTAEPIQEAQAPAMPTQQPTTEPVMAQSPWNMPQQEQQSVQTGQQPVQQQPEMKSENNPYFAPQPAPFPGSQNSNQ